MSEGDGQMRRDGRPNVLFVMTDQQRFDTIHALGCSAISTPNIDRLVRRGAVFDHAYSATPVCVPARYTIMSGCDATRTNVYDNWVAPDGHEAVRRSCGPYLPEAMAQRGYRTFGVGKFHTSPWNAELGFDQQLHSEEFYGDEDQRSGDAYASWIRDVHPEYDWIEALMGERTEMYYMPQMSPTPPEVGVESWATDRAIEAIRTDDGRPFFVFVSYIGPHPPFAPPLPFNRMYDPDAMQPPRRDSDVRIDHLDQQLPWMNYAVFAEDVDPLRAQALKARYFGEISYIDECIGRLLDEIDSRPDADNTLICFYSDHGDLLGDHHGWQKESFFEESARIPFLVSWPQRIEAGVHQDDLVCLADLFGLATSAAGESELRQGVDILGLLSGQARPRDLLFGFHGRPGTRRFKAMVRSPELKLIWMANGGHRLLYDLNEDPRETSPLDLSTSGAAAAMTSALAGYLRGAGVGAAFEPDDPNTLRTFGYESWPKRRIYQFDLSRGVTAYTMSAGSPGASAQEDAPLMP
jgi:choline-sulfatase